MRSLDPRPLLLGGSITALVIVASWGVRQAIERHLALGEVVSLIGEIVRLTRGENSGIAFGLLRGSPLIPWLSVAGLIVLAILAAQQRSRLTSLAWGLMLGGGLANVLDRIDNDRVTDYLAVAVGTWHYPTFNLPDVAITVGVIVLLGSLVLSDDPQAAGDEHSDATGVRAPQRTIGETPPAGMDND